MFYVSCNLGFEEDLALEIKECWPWLIGTDGQANHEAYPTLTVDKGGVLVDCPLAQGVQLNFFLKTAHRILWRVAEFKVRDFPKLYEKVRQIEWSKFLSSANVEWVVSASQSRLNNEKRIEETCKESFRKVFPLENKNLTSAQKVFIRMHQDICTISLDSTGDHLHKRGWGQLKGEAPLRETLAAFVVRQMIGEVSLGELREITLVDPMCGSGTLLLEALSLWCPVFERDYSFLRWKQTPKIFKTELWKKNYKLLVSDPPFKNYCGYDVEAKVIEAANLNLAEMLKKVSIQNAHFRFIQEDLFKESSDSSRGVFGGKTWCICNPPYGERIHVLTKKPISYEDLLKRMIEKFDAKKIGLLLPNKPEVRKIRLPENLQKILEVPFSNGGIDVVLLIVERLDQPMH
ncbi:MAG: RNA methyltransferase [Bdellovibrionaceae bacterium]|nr:RNA methyltransferase [Pseudobdellovibrionaceae bacterium]